MDCRSRVLLLFGVGETQPQSVSHEFNHESYGSACSALQGMKFNLVWPFCVAFSISLRIGQMVSATNALGGKLFDDDTIAAIRNRCIEGFPGMVDGRASYI